jgi:hypothetical protein
MPLEEAEAQLALARSGLEQPAAARDRLLEAKAQLAALGCEYHLRVCEAELQRVEQQRAER